MKQASAEKSNGRQSGIELMRIVGILLVLLLHYSANGGYDQTNVQNLSPNRVLLQVISMYGRMACMLFMLTTGYFSQDKCIYGGTTSKYKIIQLVGMLYFYSALALIAAILFGDISLKALLISLMPMFYGSNWYIRYYIFFLLFIPFLQHMLCGLNQSQCRKLVIITLVVWSVIPTFSKYSVVFSNFDDFLVGYILGAYIAKYGTRCEQVSKWKILCAALITMTITAASVLVIDAIGILGSSNQIVELATYFKEYNSVLSLGTSLLLFEYFRRVNLTNKFINMIGKTVPGILLFSDAELQRRIIWRVISPNNSYINSNLLLIHIIIKVGCVFIVGCLIEIVRQHIFDKRIKNMLSKYEKDIDGLTNCIGQTVSKYIDRSETENNDESCIN